MILKDWAEFHLNNLILDTETTGLGNAEIVEVAITRRQKIIYSTLVKPTISIPQHVTKIHGISDIDVADAPTFPQIYKFLRYLLYGQTVLIYNAQFDHKIIDYCCDLHELPRIDFKSECVMLSYSEYVGEWSSYHNNYKWQKLPGSRSHRASDDCLATYDVMRLMAGLAVGAC